MDCLSHTYEGCLKHPHRSKSRKWVLCSKSLECRQPRSALPPNAVSPTNGLAPQVSREQHLQRRSVSNLCCAQFVRRGAMQCIRCKTNLLDEIISDREQVVLILHCDASNREETTPTQTIRQICKDQARQKTLKLGTTCATRRAKPKSVFKSFCGSIATRTDR